MAKVFGAKQCFLHCMTLDPETQDDPENPLCRSRPDQGTHAQRTVTTSPHHHTTTYITTPPNALSCAGLDAVSELAPGLVTGPLTVVFKKLVDEGMDMGYEPDRHA